MFGILDYFWHLIPANPILLRVVETAGKRRRDLFIRCIYLGLLVVFVLGLLVNENTTGQSMSALARTSGKVFQSLSYVQLALVALLAPIFTAGAITQEKDSQTYDILLSTPLTNGQIVLGSLLSRMFFVIMLLVSGIPIFSITQIFGGVAIGNILASFMIAAATAFITGSLAMTIATFKVGTRKTIFSFYLFIVFYLVGFFLLDKIEYFHPVIGYDTDPNDPRHTIAVLSKTSWFTGVHPFLALRTLFFDKEYTPPDYGSLPNNLKTWPFGFFFSRPAAFYISTMFTLSFLMVVPSILMLRWIAQTSLPFKAWFLTKLHLASADRTRKPRSVWSNPIAWREARTKGSAVKGSFVRYGFIALGVIGAIVLAVAFSEVVEPESYITYDSYNAGTGVLTVYPTNKGEPHRYALTPKTEVIVRTGSGPDDHRPGGIADLRNRWAAFPEVNADNSLARVTVAPYAHRVSEDMVRNYLLGAVVLEFAIILLIVTNAAASTVTREKEDGTLDLLLTTPITSRYYIWGKLRGLVYFVLPLVAVPVASVLVFVIYDLFRFTGGSPGDKWIAFPESVILLPLMLVIVSAFAAITGMQMSLRCRTTVVAVMASVGVVVGACFLMGFCGFEVLNSHDASYPSVVIGSFSPFTLMTILISPYQFAEHVFRGDEDVSTARFVVGFTTVIAVAAYAGLVWYMYTSMVKNFDMTIRRQQR